MSKKQKKKKPSTIVTGKEKDVKSANANRVYIISGVSFGVVALIAVALAVILPIVKINADFDNIFNEAKKMKNPNIIVSDMMAENSFSGASGEVVINDLSSAIKIIDELSDIATDFKYDKRVSNTVGSWDIRIKITDIDGSVTVYLADGRMYYEKSSVKYIFVPDDGGTAEKYSAFYKNICLLVR